LADYLAIYLVSAGAAVERAPDLAAAQEKIGTAPPGPWVWLIDVHNRTPLSEELRAITAANPGCDIRFVVVGRGRRLRLRKEENNQLVNVDGNLLTRQAVIQVVAVAAGRTQQAQVSPQQREGRITKLVAPSRADAVQQGRLILVAEDNETNQKVIVRQLNLLGFTSDVANDGEEALERWHSGDYALLLTDLHMPKMDGYELTIAIRAEENNARHIPIVALTANALKGEELHCFEMGMDDYLSKPAALADMQTMLEKWLPAATAVKPGAQPADPVPDSADSSPGSVVTPPAQPAVSTRVQVLDVSVLAALVGDDPAIISDFLHDFQRSAIQIEAEINAAFNEGQAQEVGALAHKLKSSARSVGALPLGELCEEMEQAGKAGRMDVLAELLPSFEAEMAAVITCLDSL
jgi:CheY-like chemotaxis protein/HPt (histidine-containing phosphotransfer) domain-containing protein